MYTQGPWVANGTSVMARHELLKRQVVAQVAEEADAYLIILAPELLEALTGARALLQYNERTLSMLDNFDAAQVDRLIETIARLERRALGYPA